ncbi:uncharacterized protein N7529_008173 [Penicillium soppii]|uniref:uncharacterized protein n=1 Tax=Penicillium soppii TaxID=69789 RepID=UPI002548D2F8|nr:uncharacterized protein N7529_008173 [Penicillium soppii]KAJ5860863.1 hypothetical protein N7529_008173 [Penicillium soppii]
MRALDAYDLARRPKEEKDTTGEGWLEKLCIPLKKTFEGVDDSKHENARVDEKAPVNEKAPVDT